MLCVIASIATIASLGYLGARVYSYWFLRGLMDEIDGPQEAKDNVRIDHPDS